MNVQFGRLGPLGRTGALAALRSHRFRPGRFQTAGLDVRTRLLPFEEGDFVTTLLDRHFQLLNAVLLHPDDGEEAFDQRGAFFRPDLGKLDLHTAECTKPSPGQLRQIPGLLRSYGKLAELGGRKRLSRVKKVSRNRVEELVTAQQFRIVQRARQGGSKSEDLPFSDLASLS